MSLNGALASSIRKTTTSIATSTASAVKVATGSPSRALLGCLEQGAERVGPQEGV